MREGHTPHQSILAELVLAWVESLNKAKPTAAFERMAALLDAVIDAKTGKAMFVDLGGLIDFTNKLAVASGVPASKMASLYRPLPKAARVTGLLQLAHIYARRGEVKHLQATAKALRTITKDPKAELVLTLAELEELAPQADPEAGAPIFDTASARAASAALSRLATVARKGGKSVKNSAACAAWTYADRAVEALVEAGRLDDAAAHLTAVLEVVPEARRVPVALKLADVEDQRGRHGVAADLYGSVLSDAKTADRYTLHLIDYYQVAARAESDAHKTNAASLLAARIEPVLTEASTMFEADAAAKQDVFELVHDVLRAEGMFEALLSAAPVYASLQADELAALSCTGGNHGRFLEEVGRSGYTQHFESRERVCADASTVVTDPDARRHMASAVEYAAAGLECATTPELGVPFAVDGAEAHRLLGDVARAEAMLTSAMATFGPDASLGGQMEVLGWAALLAGDKAAAERLLSAAGTTAGAGYAGFIALSDGRFADARALFDRAAKADGQAGWTARLWSARTSKASGDTSGYLKALSALVKKVKSPAPTFAYELANDLYELGRTNAKLAGKVETQLARLAKKAPRAAGFRSLIRAQRYLDTYFLPATDKEYATVNGAAKRYVKLTSKMFATLTKRVAPALEAPRGEEKPLMGTLIPAAEIMVRGLYGIRTFLERNELISDDEQWATLVVTELDRLGAEVVGLSEATLGMANAGRYSDPALERYTRFLVTNYPDLFDPVRKHAFLCADERPRTMKAGEGALAQLMAAECTGEQGISDAERLVQMFEASRGGFGPGEATGAPAAELARSIELGAEASADVLRALAGHYNGVDCKRTVALVEQAGDAPFSLQVSAAACKGDRDRVLSLLRHKAETNPDARTLRRLAELEIETATTDDDVKKVESMLSQSASLAGMDLGKARDLTVCELPGPTI